MITEALPAAPYKDVLRFLDHQLTADEVGTLVERLRSDETVRFQAAGLLLQLGTFGELARNAGEDRVPAWRQPPARSSAARWIVAAAGVCALAAALLMVIGKPRVPARPRADRHAFARVAPARGLVPELRGGGSVLFIRGGHPDTPDAPDALIIRHLEGLGFEVVQSTDAGVSNDELSGRTLVVISASTSGRILRERLPALGLRDAPVPIVTCESSTFDLLGLTGSRLDPGSAGRNVFGSSPNHADVQIESPSHPLAGGLEGPLRIASAPVSLTWGVPGEGAIKVANMAGKRANPMSVQFAYEKGAPMVGLAAPARRVACFISTEASSVLTAEGWRLFEAGVVWAAER